MLNNPHINRIRHLLNDKRLSFIIGAGFSRNMSDYFVDWKGLLKPMVKELYHVEYDIDIKHKIDEIGYLGIASEYVKRKGYHEAIDIYIEKHTPIIKERRINASQKIYDVVLNGDVVGVADITCHKMLLDLNVQHIFTFNYDNCLDIIANTHNAKEIQLEKWENECELDSIKQQKKDYISFFNLSIEESSVKIESSIIKPKDDIKSNHQQYIYELKQKNTALHSLSDDINQKEKNIRIIENRINSLNANIIALQRQLDSVYQLISSSHMLSLTDGRKNIYKLHGSIRNNENEPYGFDGDSHCNYIITTEDYKTYFEKHEPFVNYMKISLLKGAFCIIGFSCDDPNFLSWISWVKEVIDKNEDIKRELSNKSSARFFYIHSGETPLSADKKLLLRNHYIECVELRQIFEKNNNHKSQITEFLKCLSQQSSHHLQVKKAWNKLNEALGKNPFLKKELDLSAFYEEIDTIYHSQEINRIPLQNSIENYYRDHILCILHNKLKNNWEKVSEKEITLIYSALREELLLPSHFFDSTEFDMILNMFTGNIHKNLLSLKVKEDIFKNKDSVDIQENGYLKVWYQLFNFDFDEAKRILDLWIPQKEAPFDNVRKLMFEALFSYDINEKIQPLSNPDIYQSVQDYLNALELLPTISRQFIFNENGQLSYHFDFAKEKNRITADCPYINSYEYIVNNLIESIKGKIKAKPFGNKINSFTFGRGDTKSVNSFKILSIFFELCKPLHLSNIILFPEDKWNIIVENLVESYPYPCLFYTLQYNSKKIIQKVSQSVLYCDNLYNELPKIVQKMFSALRQENCPIQYKQAIMHSLPILLKGVEASVWNNDFSLFYESLKLNFSNMSHYDDLNYSHEEFYELITCGLHLTTDVQLKLKTIFDILESDHKIGNWENHLITTAIQSLTEHDFRDSEYCDKIKQGVYKLIDNANTPPEIYAVLNLYKLVESNRIQECLERQSDSFIESDCTLIEAIPHYISKGSLLENRIKKIVLKSSFLWANGIGQGGFAVGTHFLNVSDILNNVTFTEEEKKYIFEKMISSFSQISNCYNKYKDKGDPIFLLSHFSSLLDEMKLFIENNIFTNIDDSVIKNTHDKIVKLRINISSESSQSIHEMIINDETNIAISILVDVKPEYLFTMYLSEYILIANRIIFKDSCYLSSCINHFSWVTETYQKFMPKEIFMPMLKYMLIAYKPYFNGDSDWDLIYARKENMELSLIKIYSVFAQWGGKDDFWQSYNCRYFH